MLPSDKSTPPAALHMAIVEDHDELREVLVSALERENGLKIVGAYADAETALRENDWPRTEALLVDLELPGMSGVELIRRVHREQPHVAIAVHTAHEDRKLVFHAIEAGAKGYVLKGIEPEELAEQLRLLQSGEAPVSPVIAMMLMKALGPRSNLDQAEPLSVREIELLKLLREGDRYKEAGDKLGISPHTVHTHVKRIYAKLQASERGEALRQARLRGIL
jgi:DNA-binding NarL/FixJ family response regulator